MTTKNVTQLKKVTGQTDIPFVSAGVTVHENVSGHVISEDGLTALVEASFAGEAAAARVTALEQERDAAVTARTTAENNLATANTTIATRDARITELEARVAELEDEAPISNTSRAEDKGGKGAKVAFHLSDENPMNKLADSLIGKPVAKKE
jgi:hypothetical protein